MRCDTNIFLDEIPAIIQIAIQYKMEVSVHQYKGKNLDRASLQDRVYTVHPAAEILFVIENRIHRIAIRMEMPAIPDRNQTTSYILSIQSKVRFHTTQYVCTFSHTPISPPQVAGTARSYEYFQ